MSSKQNEILYQWNPGRKIWHAFGCLLMMVIFYLWHGQEELFGLQLRGVDFLVGLAWFETLMILTIDIIRFYSPRHNEVVKNFPFFRLIITPYEEKDFNTITYYLLSSSILVTSYRLGWCPESILIMSLSVLGFADPVAAWVRHQFHKRNRGWEKTWGLVAFLAASFLVMGIVGWFLESRLSLKCMFCIGAIVALIENYTKHWVILVRPLTKQIQNLIRHWATEWLFHFYPDDNLTIPLATAFLAVILGPLI